MNRVVLYSDPGCPWAHLAVYRFLSARRRLGLDGQVVLDHRAFPLEVFNSRPTPFRILAAEIPVVGGLDPAAGWQVWQGDLTTWPVTTLPALEAVQAAKGQSLAASERLDRALRLAFFAESRCISMRHVLVEAAERAGLDAGALATALDGGDARRAVLDQRAAAEESEVKGSPHFFLPDGTNVHNPGIEMEWAGAHGEGFPVVHKDDPGIYDDLVRQGAGLA